MKIVVEVKPKTNKQTKYLIQLKTTKNKKSAKHVLKPSDLRSSWSCIAFVFVPTATKPNRIVFMNKSNFRTEQTI